MDRVSNLYPEIGKKPLDFLFFICPKLKSNGFRLNRNKTGLAVEYVKGENKSTVERLEKVKMFISEVRGAGIEFTISAIFASADAIMLFPLPVMVPPLPNLNSNIRVISNYEIVQNNFFEFIRLYNNRPWEKVPEKFVKMEYERLKSFIHGQKIPQNIIHDFIERAFTGFALDGKLIRAGHFVDNPVILGIESPGVVVLQNAALSRKQWLPVIQLC
ncbi:MAG: hypothetical protein U9R14_00170 [Patescibacteria group bacterium]|nr:hypothetical protein [Patescibacteria group bacterium]